LVPRVPPGLATWFRGLGVEASYHLEPAEFEPLRALLREGATAIHSYLRQTVQAEGQAFVINGLMGIHDFRSQPPPEAASEDYTGLYLHYHLRLRRGRATDATTPDWAATTGAVSGVIGTNTAEVELLLDHPVGGVVPAVALPIAVKEADVPGFSEIRGVRLAKTAPDGTEELYSVVIDRVGDVYRARAETRVQLPLDEQIFTSAYERTRSIAELAFHTVATS